MLNQEPATGVSGPVLVLDRELELSGCAVVDGGLLIVEDELVGSVLRVSNPGTSPLVVSTIKLERKKKNRAPFAKASKLFPIQDFEDVASDRHETVYLIGSHQAKNGERRPDREFLLRASWNREESELKVRKENYKLLKQLARPLKELGIYLELSKTELSVNVNIEGLAYNQGRLYIGLRSPLTSSGEAIVFSAPADELVEGDEDVEWQSILLDLRGGGIRAMDWDPVREALLVLSGPTEDADNARAILWACGREGKGLTEVIEFSEDVSRGKPEGVCRLRNRDGGRLFITLDGEGGSDGAKALFVDW